MLKTTSFLFIAVLATSLVLPASSRAQTNSAGAGAVFVMTNSATNNEIIVFKRGPDGSLQEGRSFPTGGRGSGGVTDPLGSQGSLTLSDNHALLFAVNAGSGTISVFRVQGSNLSLLDKVPSGGSEPVAVAQRGNLVYVLNAGGSSSVVGFHLDHDGKLKVISDSISFLSTNNSGAASLSFSPNGEFLLVTEKLTNDIDLFHIQTDGTLGPIKVNPGAGPGTFSAVFAPNGAAIVSETGPTGGSNAAVSSYSVLANGVITPISTSVPTLGAATCWQEVTPDGRFVYTANSGSSTISGFAINATGALTPLPGTVLGILPSSSTDIDLAISLDGKFLYTLNTGTGTIGIFGIHQDGTLTNFGDVSGLSASVGLNGIAAN